MKKDMSEKILYGFGDSLVDGHCIGIGMLDALAQKYGMRYHKYARNGATVIPGTALSDENAESVPDVALQIERASDVLPDFVCFDGLTNDAYPITAYRYLGEITDSYSGEYDCTTFYGAFERVCFLLRQKYGDSRIFYICPHKMPTREQKVQEILQKAAREVCGKWSIPYVDVYRRGQINTYVEEMRRKYSYDRPEHLFDGNGTHLNAAGYEKWYLPMIEDSLKSYM